MHRVLNVILTLATFNLAFRGHRKSLIKPGDNENVGNFLSIIKLIAIYDPVLEELISKPERSVNYLSPDIQNELICLLAKTVEKKIVQVINNAPFFSIISDTTQDITKIDQLSQVIWYVEIEKDESGKPKEIRINESFLGFERVDDQSASGLENKLLNGLDRRNIDLKKRRGHGYDGAAVINGIYSGVQERISQKQENATFVHCAAHRLNLVLNDTANGIPEVRKFFDLIQSIYVFLRSKRASLGFTVNFFWKQRKHWSN